MEEIYAINKEIDKLQNKLQELNKKRKRYYIKSVSNYINKYILIIDTINGYFPRECMFVRNIESINPNLFNFQGDGFSYSDGGFLDNIECYISGVRNKTIHKEDIEKGNIKIKILTGEEYKKEVRKMIKFIRKIYEC